MINVTGALNYHISYEKLKSEIGIWNVLIRKSWLALQHSFYNADFWLQRFDRILKYKNLIVPQITVLKSKSKPNTSSFIVSRIYRANHAEHSALYCKN